MPTVNFPAFPHIKAVIQFLCGDRFIRDYFAAAALQGELACQSHSHGWGNSNALATYCYVIADAMMQARALPDA